MKRLSIILLVLIVNFLSFQPSVISGDISDDESLNLYTIDVDGEDQHYYLYMPSSNPIGAVLIIPGYGQDHTYMITTTNLIESPIFKTAKEYNLALVLAEGKMANWYAPDNGEKKVLACMSHANTTYLSLGPDKWFISGFSMGGLGVLTITIRHPNLFAGLAANAGVLNLTEEDNMFRLSLVWGSEEAVLAINPYINLEVFSNKALFMCCGLKDDLLTENDNFSLTLDEAGIDHYYFRENYGHEVAMLEDCADETFDLFVHKINGNLDVFFEDYISPLTPSEASDFSIFPILIVLPVFYLNKKRKASK